jgi:hypothetical protein
VTAFREPGYDAPMRGLWIVWVGCSLLSCNENHSKQKHEDNVAATPSNKMVLPKVTVDGQKFAVQSAISFTSGGDSISVWLSNQPVDCKSVPEHVFVKPGEKQVRLVLARHYRATPAPWTVRWLSFVEHSGLNVQVPPKEAQFDVTNVGNDKRVEASAALSADIPGTTKHVVNASGGLKTRGCGAIAFPNDGTPRPQRELDTKVLGEAVGLRGVRLIGGVESPTKVELSTSPLPDECNVSPVMPEDMRLSIELRDGKPTGAALDGTRFDDLTLPNLEWNTFVLGKPAGDVVPVELQFATGLIHVSGIARARVCK